jgi:hypothetical protein
MGSWKRAFQTNRTKCRVYEINIGISASPNRTAEMVFDARASDALEFLETLHRIRTKLADSLSKSPNSYGGRTIMHPRAALADKEAPAALDGEVEDGLAGLIPAGVGDLEELVAGGEDDVAGAEVAGGGEVGAVERMLGSRDDQLAALVG